MGGFFVCSSKLLDLALARQRKGIRELCGNSVSRASISRIRRGENVKPKTVGCIAQALGVDPVEIIMQDTEAQRP